MARWRPATYADFLADPTASPVGRCIVGPSYVVWCHERSLLGASVFGRPTEADAQQMVRIFDGNRHPAIAGSHDQISDGRYIESVDPAAFACVAAYMTSRAEELRRRVRRHAVVIPSGMSGAVLLGAGEQTGAVGFHQTFSDVGEAFTWLERPDADDARAELERVLTLARGSGSHEVAALRAHLAQSPDAESLAATARVIGCSSRALQRALTDAGTTFRAEVAAARLQVARDLLRDSDEKIEVIARRVGFASAPNFCRWFRQKTGRTPTAMRAETRAQSNN
jgi:AraC-like DNA-binding protein